MLEVGNGGMTEDEYRAHFSLWAMLAAPLMAGNDVRDMSATTRAILTAPEVLAIDQDSLGRQGRRVRRHEKTQVWVRDLADGAHAVLFLNCGEKPARVAVTWADLGFNGPRAVRDLWERAELGVSPEGHEANVPPHAVAMFRATPA
jgi:alpha-galactosidase